MESAVQICNLALVRVGVKNTIQDLEEGSVESDVCREIFDIQRDLALGAWWWSFAKGRKDLGRLALDARDDWAFAYALPSDCIQPRFLWAGRTDDLALQIPFDLEADELGENT